MAMGTAGRPRTVITISRAPQTRAQVSRVLRQGGFRVLERDDASQLASVALLEPDLVVLDASESLVRALGDCRMLALALQAPVLVLLGVASERAEVMCFNAGAADVVLARATSALLLARVHAALGEMRTRTQGTELSVGPLRLQRWSRRLWCGDRPVPLRRTELTLIETLMARPTQVVERAELMRIVWDGTCTDRALDSAASRTRQSVLAAGGPRVIVPMRGVGYRLGIA